MVKLSHFDTASKEDEKIKLRKTTNDVSNFPNYCAVEFGPIALRGLL